MVRFQSHCTANYHILTVVAGSKHKLERKQKNPKKYTGPKKGQLKAGRRESRSKNQKKGRRDSTFKSLARKLIEQEKQIKRRERRRSEAVRAE